MVPIRSLVIAVVSMTVLTLPADALAETIGAACWRQFTAGAFESDLYRLSFVVDAAQPTVASVIGEVRRDGMPDLRPVSGSAVVGIVPNSVSMFLIIAPSLPITYFVRTDFSLTDLVGTWLCQFPSGVPCSGSLSTPGKPPPPP